MRPARRSLVVLVFGLEYQRKQQSCGLGRQLVVNCWVKSTFGEDIGELGEMVNSHVNNNGMHLLPDLPHVFGVVKVAGGWSFGSGGLGSLGEGVVHHARLGDEPVDRRNLAAGLPVPLRPVLRLLVNVGPPR